MSQIDRTSSITNQARADYYKEQKRQKESYDKDLEAQKKRYEKTTAQRKESNQNEINEVKDKYEKRFDELKSKSIENSKRFQSKVQNQTKREQEQNLKNLAEEREKFQRRVEDLNTQYTKELTAQEKRHFNVEENQRNNFKNNLTKKEVEFVDHIEKTKLSHDDHNQDVIKKSKLERNDLEKKYTDILSEQTGSEMKKRQLQNEASSSTLERTLADNKLALKIKDMERSGQVSDIRDQSNKLIEKRMADEKANHEAMLQMHNKDSEKVRTDNERRLNQINTDHLMEKRIRDYQEGRKAESIQRSQNSGLSVTQKEKDQEVELRRWKERNKSMEEKLGNQQVQYIDNIKELQQKNRMEVGNALQQKEVSSDTRVMDVLAAERLKFDKSQSVWQGKQMADKEIFDRTNRNNEKILKNRVTNLNETYTQRLQDLNDKNTNMLTGLKREHLLDKREFATNIETQFNKKQLELVKGFENKQDLLMSEYEKKIATLEAQNQELTTHMHSTVNRIRREESQKMVNQQDMIIEQKKDSERALHEMMSKRESELRNTIHSLHEDYANKINEQEKSFKDRIGALTSEYEQKMFHLQKSTNQELNSKNSELVRERKALLTTFEDEKKRISGQYENIIKNMKTAHQDHLANLNKYQKVNDKLSA